MRQGLVYIAILLISFVGTSHAASTVVSSGNFAAANINVTAQQDTMLEISAPSEVNVIYDDQPTTVVINPCVIHNGMGRYRITASSMAAGSQAAPFGRQFYMQNARGNQMQYWLVYKDPDGTAEILTSDQPSANLFRAKNAMLGSTCANEQLSTMEIRIGAPGMHYESGQYYDQLVLRVDPE